MIHDARTNATQMVRGIAIALAGGVIAATLDLAYISAFWGLKGVGPQRVLQGVAAGWTGRDAAIAGGHATAALGLATHYAIAAVMALAYFLAATQWPTLARHPLRHGPLYGVVLYVAMTYLVVPLSAAGRGVPPFQGWADAAHLAAHMFLVATPIAWFVHRALAHPPRSH